MEGLATSPQDQGTPMSETLKDYIPRLKTFSTFLGRSRHPHAATKGVPHEATSTLDPPTPLPPKTDPPK